MVPAFLLPVVYQNDSVDSHFDLVVVYSVPCDRGRSMAFVHVDEARGVCTIKRRGKGEVAIYALFDEADRRVRYVGMTSRPIHVRLQWHKKSPTNSKMAYWIANGRPQITILEYVPKSEWEDAERGWIHWFKQRGELLNVDRGGAARDADGRLRKFVAGAYVPPTRESSKSFQSNP